MVNTAPINPERVSVFIDHTNVFYSIKDLRKIDKNWIKHYDPLQLANKLKQKNMENANATGLVYNGINGHLKNVLQLNNYYIQKHIDLILIDIDIEIFISETFDYNMLKNYIYQKKLYMNNEIDVINKHAKMNIDTFYQIFNNEYKFNNFIKRYQKYTSRGFQIFLCENEFTIQLFEIIVKFIINKLTNICNKKLGYRLNNENFSGHLSSFEYIKMTENDIILKGIDNIQNKEYFISFYDKQIIDNPLPSISVFFNVKNILISYKESWNKNDYLGVGKHYLFINKMKEDLVKKVLHPERIMNKIKQYGLDITLDNI